MLYILTPRCHPGKLADFGLLAEENSTVPRAGTLRYVAPEVSSGPDEFQQNKASADMWSFGVCLWEMATRAQFSGLPLLTPANQRILFHSKLPYPMPTGLYQIIEACLEPDPYKRRITAGEANEGFLDCLDMVLDEDRTSWFTGEFGCVFCVCLCVEACIVFDLGRICFLTGTNKTCPAGRGEPRRGRREKEIRDLPHSEPRRE
jgi:serine/threonine protein kinase